jgi:hypothetical protein
MHCHILGHEDLMMMINFDPTVAERPDGVPISRNYAPPAFNPYVHHEPQGIDTTDITNTTELAASLNALTRRSSRKGRGASGRGSKGHRGHRGHRGHAGHRGHIRQRFVLADERQSDRPTDDFRRDSLISGGERRRQRQPHGGPGRDADRHRIAGLSGSDALLSSSRSWLDALAEANPLGQLAAQEALTSLS